MTCSGHFAQGLGDVTHFLFLELWVNRQREDFAARARDNVERFHGPAPNWRIQVGDAFEGFAERGVDRIVVDLAEPWRLLDRIAEALRPGGVVTGFVPTVLQVKEFVDGLRAHGSFASVEMLETLTRFWHVRERSLRPEPRQCSRALPGAAPPGLMETAPARRWRRFEWDRPLRTAGGAGGFEAGVKAGAPRGPGDCRQL